MSIELQAQTDASFVSILHPGPKRQELETIIKKALEKDRDIRSQPRGGVSSLRSQPIFRRITEPVSPLRQRTDV
jgi:hypothetical protein